MNIGVDLRSLQSPFRTGVGEFTFELLSSLFEIDKSNHYYLFFNSSTEVKIDFVESENVHILKTKIPNKLFSLLGFLGLIKLDKFITKKFNQKLDYFFSPHLNFSSFSKDTKHILVIHDLTYELFPEFLTLKQLLWHKLTKPKQQCQKAHFILTPSENTRRDVVNYFKISNEKVRVIYPGLSNIFSKPQNSNVKKKYDLEENYILFLGTIEPRKNINAVVKAFEAASPYLLKPIQLVIAGAPGWKNQDVLEEVKKSRFKERIKILDYIPEEDKFGIYNGAALFLYPSFYEGFGFPVLEALASGVPVITSNRSSLLEVGRNAAYYVDPNRPDEIKDAILKIIGSADLKEEMIKREKFKSNFHWKNSAEKFLNLLQKG